MRIVTVAAAAAMLGIAGCSSIAKTSTPPPAAATAPASSSTAPAPTSSLSGPVGTSYAVTDPSGNKMSVTLTQVIDPAQGADQFTSPQSGNRFVGAAFDIKGINGTVSEMPTTTPP